MRRLIFMISFMVTLTQIIYGSNTGKIFGTVVDKGTGDVLPGVNVFLVGTSLGGSTDLNGEFVILNIPPGTYVVECSYIGYQTVKMTDVKIQSDQTTILEFELQEETMELGQEIVVVADRPLVQKDLTASKKTTSAEEIMAMPVETYAGVMLTQAGVTLGADGGIHIRGGRSDEVAYLIDGVSVTNPYSGDRYGAGTQVATNAIQEMTVVSGAFNAEYGNAMSGIVNFTTKDGTPDFKTFISAYVGDYLSNRNDVFTNIDDFNPLTNKIFEGTLSGPLLFTGQNNSFFFSARYQDSDGYRYGIREHLPTDSANFDIKYEVYTYKDDEDKNITIYIPHDEWYIELNGDKAIVPMSPSERLNLMGKLKFQFGSAFTIRLQSVYDKNTYKLYEHEYKYNPDGVVNNFDYSIANTIQITHTLSPTTFYELRGAFNYRDYKSYLYANPNDPRYAPTNKIKGDPGGETFLFGGTQREHVYEISKTWIGKGDFTSQLTNRHLLKAGIEGILYDLDRTSYTIQYDRNVYQQPSIPPLTSNLHQVYNTFPRQISAYIQDKIEYTDVIINAGLRYDYFFSDAEYAVDVLQPDGERKMAEAKHRLSPRLGISFPVSSRGIIHFSYGHFYQMPPLKDLYTNPEFILPVSGTTLFGNANLNPEQTIIYEMGLQQQFGDRIAVDVTGFYKDIRDLLAWQTIQFRSEAGDIRTYRMRQNQDYGNVRGITLSFSKRTAPGDPISAKIDYTFQVAEGNDNANDAFYYNALSGYERIKKIIPLDWDQSQNLYASIGIDLWEAFNLSFIGKLSTGYPYSPQIAYSTYDTEENSGRKPTQKTVDLRAAYRFFTTGVNYEFFVKIYNLFDTLNERYVFDDTGRATYTFYNRVVDEPESFIKHYGEPGVHSYDEYNIRPNYYRSPREVRFGLSVQF